MFFHHILFHLPSITPKYTSINKLPGESLVGESHYMFSECRMNEWCSSSLSLKFSWASCSGAKWIRQDTSDSRWKKTNPSLRAFCYICLFHNQNRDAYNDETMPFAVSFADFPHQNCRFLLVLWITVRVVSDVMNIWSDTVSKWHILTTVHTWFCISYNLSEFNQIWIELKHCLKNHSRSLRFCSCTGEKKKTVPHSQVSEK